MAKLRLTFYGGARSVTGSNFMLESNKHKILVDCGLYQGEKFCEKKSCLDFAYDPAEIKALLVTHAHADHIGRIPKLVREGFRGEIYSTLETKEIARIMLDDALKFVLAEAEESKSEPIYTKEDITKTMSLWEDIPYHKNFDAGAGFSAYFKDAGHILGSAIVEITYNGKKVVFSGDLGNSPTPFLRNVEEVSDADYIVIESVYGDRNHEDVDLRRERLKNVIERTIKKHGTLLIPAFSVSRTQVLLHELNELVEKGELPEIPVFLDSPLGIRVTEIYKKFQENFKKSKIEQIAEGDDIFEFPKLKFTPEIKNSKAIKDAPDPKVIIAGAGMSTGGRIVHHEKRYLSNPNNTILFVGYQAPGSLGRMIQDGEKKVEIDGTMVEVNAQIETITGYSAHMDSGGLLDFVEHATESGKLKKVFVAMGEPKSSMFLVQRIKDYLDIDAVVPEEGESFELDF